MAGDDLILFLRANDDEAVGWVRASEGAIVAQGEGLAGIDGDSYDRIIALTPAGATGIDWIELPELAPAQRDAAARGLVLQRIIEGDVAHIAAGIDDDPSGLRPVAWVNANLMSGWLAKLGDAGLSPDAVIPALLAIEPIDSGVARAEVGGEILLRAAKAGWRDDPELTPLLLDGEPITDLSDRATEAGLLRLIDAPALNLLSGRFATRSGWSVPAGTFKPLVVVAGLCLLLALLLPVVHVWQINRAAARLEMQAVELASKRFPEASDPLAALKADVAATRGGGAGFIATAAAVNQAVAATANADLLGMSFTPNGALMTTVRVTNADEAAGLIAQIEGAGFRVAPGAQSMNQGRLVQPITVTVE